jgi:hypothetical protein
MNISNRCLCVKDNVKTRGCKGNQAQGSRIQWRISGWGSNKGMQAQKRYKAETVRLLAGAAAFVLGIGKIT